MPPVSHMYNHQPFGCNNYLRQDTALGVSASVWILVAYYMLRTAQLGGPVLKASGSVQYTPFQLGDKSPMITDQHTAGGLSKQIKPTGQALTLISPFHKRHYYIIPTLQ